MSPFVPALDLAISAAGAAIVLVGLADAFLTILHPDRDGYLSYLLNRGIWRFSVGLAHLRPNARRSILGMAGPTMVVADILLWMLVPILGYGLLVWPHLGTGFDTPPGLELDVWDAFYFSGVTFTTLGFGDITPLSGGWELVAIAEAITGFLVMSTSIAYIIAVFEGVDQRDALALQVCSETGGTWRGDVFLERILHDEGAEPLRKRIETWAALVRSLHGRLYRFHGLALYLRTHGLDRGPERMTYALCDVALRARVVAQSPTMRNLRPASEHLAFGLEHFARGIVLRNGGRACRHEMETATPTEADIRYVREAWETAAARLGLERAPAAPWEDPAILAFAARMRIFLSEIDRLTLWRTLGGDHRGPS